MTAEEIFSKKFKEAVIENEYLPAFSREEIINLLNEFARIKCEEMRETVLSRTKRNLELHKYVWGGKTEKRNAFLPKDLQE